MQNLFYIEILLVNFLILYYYFLYGYKILILRSYLDNNIYRGYLFEIKNLKLEIYLY
jgi:hypothetical protein